MSEPAEQLEKARTTVSLSIIPVRAVLIDKYILKSSSTDQYSSVITDRCACAQTSHK